jgi:hypothetical protein
VDYTLTVAVSTAAGTAALTSAFPALSPATVPICLAVLAVITLLNLRGLGYAARAFLLPTMVFIVGLLAILAIGLLHPLALHAAPLSRSLLPARAMEPVGLLLLLKAFSAGCSALTGVEAIANGVPLFKPPRVRRAKRTELLLGVILGAMLLGVATLAGRWRVAPSSGQTVLSHQDPPLLRPGRARPRHRRNPRQAPGQVDRGRGARDRGVEARPVRDFGGAVYQRARGGRHSRPQRRGRGIRASS